MSNEIRGEVTLLLGKKEYTLRPSFAAVQAFEKQTGKGLIELVQGVGTLSLVDASIIVTECIKAQGRHVDDKMMANYSVEKVGELIFETGIATTLATLSILLTMAATGGYDPTGEVKAEIQNKAAIPAEQ